MNGTIADPPDLRGQLIGPVPFDDQVDVAALTGPAISMSFFAIFIWPL